MLITITEWLQSIFRDNVSIKVAMPSLDLNNISLYYEPHYLALLGTGGAGYDVFSNPTQYTIIIKNISTRNSLRTTLPRIELYSALELLGGNVVFQCFGRPSPVLNEWGDALYYDFLILPPGMTLAVYDQAYQAGDTFWAAISYYILDDVML